MNTLPEQITRRFFHSPDGYERLKERMRALMRDDKRLAAAARTSRDRAADVAPDPDARGALTAGHNLVYLVLRGKDWRKAFAPVTNERKLANGARRWQAATNAIRELHSEWNAEPLIAPYADLLAVAPACADDTEQGSATAPDALALIRRLVPRGAGYGWQADLDDSPAYTQLSQLEEAAA